MSIKDIVHEWRQTRQSFQHLRESIKNARPNGISPEEAAEIAEDVAQFAQEVADLIGVSVANKEIVVSTIKQFLRP